MEYRRFGDTIIARMDKGEEIIEQVRRIAEAEKIGLASIEALGALNDFNVGLFDVTEKKFHGNHFHGDVLQRARPVYNGKGLRAENSEGKGNAEGIAPVFPSPEQGNSP